MSSSNCWSPSSTSGWLTGVALSAPAGTAARVSPVMPRIATAARIQVWDRGERPEVNEGFSMNGSFCTGPQGRTSWRLRCRQVRNREGLRAWAGATDGHGSSMAGVDRAQGTKRRRRRPGLLEPNLRASTKRMRTTKMRTSDVPHAAWIGTVPGWKMSS